VVEIDAKRRYRRPDPVALLIGAAGLALFISFSVELDWPAASSARNDLRGLYGIEDVEIRKLKNNTFDEACGYYSVASSDQLWKYLESRQGLWAEQKSERWRKLGSSSPEDALWEHCIKRERHGRGAYLYPLFDELTVLAMRVM
jgi:hypothetical protein